MIKRVQWSDSSIGEKQKLKSLHKHELHVNSWLSEGKRDAITDVNYKTN